MAEVQGFSYAVFMRVAFHDLFLHGDGCGNHILQNGKVRVLQIEVYERCPHASVAYKSVFQHLGIARLYVHKVECFQKTGVDNHCLAVVEHANFVFQSVEVYARLSAYRCIYHCKQCRGNVYEINSALECRGCKPSKVGNHSASEVHHARVPCRPVLSQRAPHFYKRIDVFLLVGNTYCYECSVCKALHVFQHRKAFGLCRVVGQDKHLVVSAFIYGFLQPLFQIV